MYSADNYQVPARMQTKQTDARPRRAAAVVELAVCLPIFMLLLLGSIDACNMVFLKQTMTASAYEAARDGIQPDGTTAAATLLAHNVLDARNITGYTVTTTPPLVETADPGDTVRVTVSAPAAANSPVPVAFRRTANITAEVVMVKQ